MELSATPIRYSRDARAPRFTKNGMLISSSCRLLHTFEDRFDLKEVLKACLTRRMDTSKCHLFELQPLHIDTNIDYDLDTTLFPGLDDPEQLYQPALLIATDWSDFTCTDGTAGSCNCISAEDTDSTLKTLATDLHFEDLPDLLPCLDDDTLRDLIDDVTTDTDSSTDYFENINVIKPVSLEKSTLSSSNGEDRGVYMSFPSDSLCNEELSPFSDLLSPFSDELPLLSDDLPPFDGEEPVFDEELPFFDDNMNPFVDIEHKGISLNDFTSALNLQISSMVSSNQSCLADLHPIYGQLGPTRDQ